MCRWRSRPHAPRARLLGLFDARAGFDRLLDLCIRTEHFNACSSTFDVLVAAFHAGREQSGERRRRGQRRRWRTCASHELRISVVPASERRADGHFMHGGRIGGGSGECSIEVRWKVRYGAHGPKIL